MKVHRRIKGLLGEMLIRYHLRDVLRRGTMEHFAVNSGFSELHILHVEAAAFHVSQLAGVTDSANGLVTSSSVEFFPRPQIGSFASRRINDFPVINRLLGQLVVLDGENVNLAVGQLGRVRLLEL